MSSTVFRDDDATLSLDIFERFLEEASGVVLLYDVTRKSTFDCITSEGYLDIIRNRKQLCDDVKLRTRMQRFGCVLVGNKLDLAKEKREVTQELAQDWGQSQGMMSFEVDTFSQEPINEVMKALVRSIKKAERLAKEDIEEVERMKRELQKSSRAK